MIVRMAKVEILGPKDDLFAVLDLLRGRGVFQPDPELFTAGDSSAGEGPQTLILDQEEVRERRFFEELRSRILQLLELIPDVSANSPPIQPLPVMELLDELVDQHLSRARADSEALTIIREEIEQLQHNLLFWQVLEPLLAEMPQDSGLELLGVTIRDQRHLAELENLLQAKTSGRCHISTTKMSDGTLVGLVATDRQMAATLRQALTDERVPEMRMSEELSRLSLAQRIEALQASLAELQTESRRIDQSLIDLSRQWLAIYRQALSWLEDRLSLFRASAAAYATRQCFVIQGWMAASEVEALRKALAEATEERAVLEQQAILDEDLDRVPVTLRNPGYFAPFEIFSRLLPLPRYTSFDPTPFIGLFLPVLFGMILGDIGYGLILGTLSLILRLHWLRSAADRSNPDFGQAIPLGPFCQ